MSTPYIDQSLRHAGSAEVLFNGYFEEPAGTIARTIPRFTTGVANLTGGPAGTVQARLLGLPAGMVVANIAVLSGTTAEVGGQHFWAGLADVNGVVLGASADQSGAAYVTANTFLKNALASPVVIPQTGPYYVLVSVAAGTTMPSFAGASLAQGAGAVPPILSGTMGVQATPPAPGTVLSAISVTNQINFMAWLS